MAKYKKITNIFTNEVDMVQDTETTAFIPMSTDNTDYQAVLKWVADGNTIEEAD
tara:strand:+ start:574 stop:735 length:162 start_codon:yes stop_codon:yes gene_type:complete